MDILSYRNGPYCNLPQIILKEYQERLPGSYLRCVMGTLHCIMCHLKSCHKHDYCWYNWKYFFYHSSKMWLLLYHHSCKIEEVILMVQSTVIRSQLGMKEGVSHRAEWTILKKNISSLISFAFHAQNWWQKRAFLLRLPLSCKCQSYTKSYGSFFLNKFIQKQKALNNLKFADICNHAAWLVC